MSSQLKDYINSKRMCCIEGSFCPCPQPTVFCHIFLNSSDNIWTLSYKIPLVCPLTSPILLSTSLRRCLVPSDLVQLLAESVTTTAPPAPRQLPSTPDGQHLHAQVGHQWSAGDRHWNSSHSMTVSALP